MWRPVVVAHHGTTMRVSSSERQLPPPLTTRACVQYKGERDGACLEHQKRHLTLSFSLSLSLWVTANANCTERTRSSAMQYWVWEREIDGWDERERERGEYRVGVSEDCSWKKSKKEGQKYYGAVLKIAGLTFNCWFGLKNRKQKVNFRKKFQNILLKALIHFISSWTVICESAYLFMEHFQS